MVPQVGMNCLRRHFLFSNLFQTLPLLITFFATQLLKLWSDNFLYISNFQNDCIRVIWPPLIFVHFASHLFNKKNSLHCFSSYKAKLLIDRGVLHPVTVYWAVYKCPDPWHWIRIALNNGLNESSGGFTSDKSAKIVERESLKQLSTTALLNSLSQGPKWQRPCIPMHVKKASRHGTWQWCQQRTG